MHREAFSKKLYLKVFILILANGSILLSNGILHSNEPFSLESLVEEALLNNPQLISAKKGYEAEKAKIPQETALDEPWVGIEYEEIPKKRVDLQDAPMKMYSFSQEIPFPTKIITRTKAQKESANAAYQRYKEKEREIILKVKSAYSELCLVYRAVDVTKENKILLEQLANTTSTRFSLGKVAQQDVLKAQVEIAKMDNELIMLEQKREVVVARLNTLLNRDPQQELGIPKINEEITHVRLIDEYYRLAKEKRPGLLAFRNEVKKQKEMYSLAIQNYLPDFMIQAEQREMDSHLNGWDAMVKVKLPLWFMQKQSFQIKQMKRELEMSEAEYKNMENMTLLEVKEAHSLIESFIKLSNLYKSSFIPQAEQTLKASLTAYESGQVDLLNLLDSQRMLLDFKLEYYEVLVNLEIAKADLERAVGVDLF